MIAVKSKLLNDALKRCIYPQSITFSTDGSTMTLEINSKHTTLQLDIDADGKEPSFTISKNINLIGRLPTIGVVKIKLDNEVVTMSGHETTLTFEATRDNITQLDKHDWRPVVGNLIRATKIGGRDKPLFIVNGVACLISESGMVTLNEFFDIDDLGFHNETRGMLKKNHPNEYAVHENEVLFSGDDFRMISKNIPCPFDPTQIIDMNYAESGVIDGADLKKKISLFSRDIFIYLSKFSSINNDVVYAEIKYKGVPITFSTSPEQLVDFIKKQPNGPIEFAVNSSKSRPIIRIRSKEMTGYFSHRRN